MIEVTTNVVCDDCGNIMARAPEGKNKQAFLARSRAREQGWIARLRDGHKVDVCPDCQEPPEPKADEDEKVSPYDEVGYKKPQWGFGGDLTW